MTSLRIVPPGKTGGREPTRAEIAADLRQLMDVTRQLCDVLDEYLDLDGQPARRPKLRVIPGGKAGRK